MKIVFTLPAIIYLKRRNSCSINTAKEQLLKVLEPYNSKFPQKFWIKITKNNIWNGRHISDRAVEISSKYVLDLSSNFSDTGRAILECLGHEFGHGKAYFHLPFFFVLKSIFLKLSSKKEKFKYRCIEVFCDHNSISFTGFTEEEHKTILSWHLKEKKSERTDLYHPTWSERINYIEKPFDENLIRQIATDNGYKNEKEIKKVIAYFDKVKEKDGYVLKREKILTFLSAAFTIFLFLSFIFILCNFQRII